MSGNKIKRQQPLVLAGFNTGSLDIPAGAGKGLYVLTVKNSHGEMLYHSKLVRNY